MLFVNLFLFEHLMLSFPAHPGDGSDSTDAIQDEASLLVNEEVERKLISVIEGSFSAASSVKAV